MKFFRALGVYFYSAVVILNGLLLIFLALFFSYAKNIQTYDVISFFTYIQNNLSFRIALGVSGTLLIVISIWVADAILGKFQREKTIAFPTPSGEVTIALSAIEDLIRRLAGQIPGIKELRPDVIAKKGGNIIVDLRVILKSEANIPELTERLQEVTRSKIQEVLGVEGQIIIKIHVLKISQSEERERKRRESEIEEPKLPFNAYKRI